MSSRGHKLITAQMASYQPQSFAFSDENQKKAKAIIAKYPAGKQQSALMPLLTLAQEQNENWLPVVAMDYVADMLSIPHMRAYEVATFYTMYNLEPVGKYFIEVCTTTPCWLRGSDEIVATCKDELGISIGETTPDGKFTLVEVECLCACVNAPVVQVGQHYYEDLDGKSIRQLLRDLRSGKEVTPGPQIGRKACEPIGGLTTLKDMKPAAKAAAKPKATKAAREGELDLGDEPAAKKKAPAKKAVAKKPAAAKKTTTKPKKSEG